MDSWIIVWWVTSPTHSASGAAAGNAPLSTRYAVSKYVDRSASCSIG